MGERRLNDRCARCLVFNNQASLGRYRYVDVLESGCNIEIDRHQSVFCYAHIRDLNTSMQLATIKAANIRTS